MGSVPRINCLLAIVPLKLIVGVISYRNRKVERDLSTNTTDKIKVFHLYLTNYLILLKLVKSYSIASNSKAA